MKNLHPNWLTEGLIDFEYKQYMLLAYLQQVRQAFGHRKLYPFLADLVFHYQNLLQIRQNKQLLYENFPKRISHADFEKLKIVYQKIVDDDDAMREIEEIVQFAIPRMAQTLANGKEIYEEIEQNLAINPVGLIPMHLSEGYFFLNEYPLSHTHLYRYQITIFEHTDEKYRGINTTFVESFKKSVGETYESLKISLIRRFRQLPNPATFVIEAKVPCPLEESLLPVAKRMLVRHVSQLA
ncbi:MAG: hypothetical protein MUC97_02040 [Bernardetiaceae bacterium]|jgi:hypothetical protein|nr:hypothetical protein [Bernardetiaceae bacterium]